MLRCGGFVEALQNTIWNKIILRIMKNNCGNLNSVSLISVTNVLDSTECRDRLVT